MYMNKIYIITFSLFCSNSTVQRFFTIDKVNVINTSIYILLENTRNITEVSRRLLDPIPELTTSLTESLAEVLQGREVQRHVNMDLLLVIFF